MTEFVYASPSWNGIEGLRPPARITRHDFSGDAVTTHIPPTLAGFVEAERQHLRTFGYAVKWSDVRGQANAARGRD